MNDFQISTTLDFPWKKNWAAPKAKMAILGRQKERKKSKRALRAVPRVRDHRIPGAWVAARFPAARGTAIGCTCR